MIQEVAYSYSRLDQYKKCPFAYNLKYNQKKFISEETLVLLLGTLIHHIEEKISLSLMEEKSPNYDELIDELYNVNIPKKNPFDTEGGIFGINILKERFTKDYFSPSDKTGLAYFNKVNRYVSNIKRQENYLLEHPELELVDVEHPFVFSYKGKTLKGFIDRIMKYKGQNRYQIYDIKTRDRLFDKKDITTPLQHVIYGLAIEEETGCLPEEYFYDLVLIQEMQEAGTKGFIERGKKQLDKIFDGIDAGEYAPNPTPLCHWCCYCNTNPNVTPEGENMCPYYSLWTPQNSSFEVLNKYEDDSKTAELIEKLKKQTRVKKSAIFEF